MINPKNLTFGEAFLGELVGTMFLVMIGNGSFANATLRSCKGANGGFLQAILGLPTGLVIGIVAVQGITGAHLNPAVTIAMTISPQGNYQTWYIWPYILGQCVGAFIGELIVYLAYFSHYYYGSDNYNESERNSLIFAQEDSSNNEYQNGILGSFATVPQHKQHAVFNFLNEAIGTFILLLGVVISGKMPIPQMGAFFMGLVLFGVILSTGGPTGAGVNPARDLMPRIVHQIVKIKGKGKSNWDYAWIPVVGPIVGGIIGLQVALQIIQ